MSTENKVAVVSGASRGIGKAVALTLAKQGYHVVGTATSESGADNISAYLAGAGAQGTGKVLNISDTSSIDGFFSSVIDEFGAPNVLINNAAVTRDNLFMRMKESEWLDVINTNLNSIYYMSKACIKGMVKARHGRIVNISSVVGVTGNPGQANYCASKAGVIGFTKSLAQEIASRNITVNAIAPGFIQTDMTDVLPEEQKKALLGVIPMKKLGQAQDIADAASFLVSESAAYITGQTLHVNGGMYMA